MMLKTRMGDSGGNVEENSNPDILEMGDSADSQPIGNPRMSAAYSGTSTVAGGLGFPEGHIQPTVRQRSVLAQLHAPV